MNFKQTTSGGHASNTGKAGTGGTSAVSRMVKLWASTTRNSNRTKSIAYVIEVDTTWMRKIVFAR